jgi:hypothetical protein
MFLRSTLILLLAFWSTVAYAGEAEHPLKPLDLSSPRATLNTFLTSVDALYSLADEEYWGPPAAKPQIASRP